MAANQFNYSRRLRAVAQRGAGKHREMRYRDATACKNRPAPAKPLARRADQFLPRNHPKNYLQPVRGRASRTERVLPCFSHSRFFRA
jgi:hypothetical protein